jgi:hypothetical protein
MKSAGKSKSVAPTAEAPGLKKPAKRMMRLTGHPAEMSSPGNCRMRGFPGSDSLTVQRYLVRFLGTGSGL